MFSNFIYIIIVLLIYETYQPPESVYFTPAETINLFLFSIFLFVFITHQRFRVLHRKIRHKSPTWIDSCFNGIMGQQAVFAISLFAFDIYALNLPAYGTDVPLFSVFPTIKAVLFLLVFIAYLVILWAFAYRIHRDMYSSASRRISFIFSHLSFVVPVLLPWLLLSLTTDLVQLIPYAPIRQFLETTYGQISYFLVFMVLLAVTAPVIIRYSWRCTPLEPGEHRTRIEALCKRAGVKYADILYWPIFEGRMITAAVMGLVSRFRYILVTKGLLTHLNRQEIDAVIAHEIGHVKLKHLVFYLFFFVGYMLLSFSVFDFFVYFIVYTEPVYQFIVHSGMSQGTVFSIVITLVTVFVFWIYFRFVFGYFMRNFERQADCYVYSLFDSGLPLISTFEKIVMSSGQSPDKPNWHHFSIAERVGYLRQCEMDKQWIGRHNRKIKKSIAVYLAGMVLCGWIGYSLNFGEMGKSLNINFLEKIVHREIGEHPEDPWLYTALGDIYYNKDNHIEAVKAYEKAIGFNPESVQALNNLAWIYATDTDNGLRDASRALHLAKQAVALSDAPHILDTLAESYFINGMFHEAIAIEKTALKRADNRDHYIRQIEKFRKAMGM